MSFKKDFPEFKSFQDTDRYHYGVVPASFWNGLSGLIRSFSATEQELRANLNSIAEKVPCDTTSDWSWNYLENKIGYYVGKLRKKVDDTGRLDILMDYLAEMVCENEDRIERLNEYLEDCRMGYECRMGGLLFCKREIVWERKEDADTVDVLTETQEILKNDFQQAFEEYTRAIETWKDAADERARKDVVRSCVNAMEAIVKICANENDIKNATVKLKKDARWGKNYFIKQGLSIFTQMHELYPDLRHGSIDTSEMPMEEAEYWVGVISAFIKYMKRQADKNGIS